MARSDSEQLAAASQVVKFGFEVLAPVKARVYTKVNVYPTRLLGNTFLLVQVLLTFMGCILQFCASLKMDLGESVHSVVFSENDCIRWGVIYQSAPYPHHCFNVSQLKSTGGQVHCLHIMQPVLWRHVLAKCAFLPYMYNRRQVSETGKPMAVLHNMEKILLSLPNAISVTFVNAA